MNKTMNKAKKALIPALLAMLAIALMGGFVSMKPLQASAQTQGNMQITLTDGIIVKYYAELAQDTQSATATFTSAVEALNATVTGTDEDGDGTWEFIYDKVTPQYVDQAFSITVNEEAMLTDYSVADYLARVIDKADATAEEKTLAKDLIYYGQAAKAYVDETYTIPDDAASGTAYAGEKGELSLTENTDKDNRIKSAAVVFDSIPAIKFYFTNASGNASVTVDGESVTLTAEADGTYSYTKTNIYATDFDKQYTVVYTNGETEQTLQYSVNDYATRMAVNSNANITENMKTLAKALWSYGAGAEALWNANNNTEAPNPEEPSVTLHTVRLKHATFVNGETTAQVAEGEAIPEIAVPEGARIIGYKVGGEYYVGSSTLKMGAENMKVSVVWSDGDTNKLDFSWFAKGTMTADGGIASEDYDDKSLTITKGTTGDNQNLYTFKGSTDYGYNGIIWNNLWLQPTAGFVKAGQEVYFTLTNNSETTMENVRISIQTTTGVFIEVGNVAGGETVLCAAKSLNASSKYAFVWWDNAEAFDLDLTLCMDVTDEIIDVPEITLAVDGTVTIQQGNAYESGFTLTVFKDGEVADENVAVTADMISDLDIYTAGTQEVTITYLGATVSATVTVEEDASIAKHTVTLKNGTFADGSTTAQVAEGAHLPEITVPEGKRIIGYKVDGEYYVGSSTLKMGTQNMTVRVVWSDGDKNDLTDMFYPACGTMNNVGYTDDAAWGPQMHAPTSTASDGEPIYTYKVNTDGETKGIYNCLLLYAGTAVKQNNEVYFTFTNNSETTMKNVRISIPMQTAFIIEIGDVAGGETVLCTAQLFAKENTWSNYVLVWWDNAEAFDLDLTICMDETAASADEDDDGATSDTKHTVTLVNGTFANGSTTAEVYEGAKLPTITLTDGSAIVGYMVDGEYYVGSSTLRMGTADMTVTVVGKTQSTILYFDVYLLYAHDMPSDGDGDCNSGDNYASVNNGFTAEWEGIDNSARRVVIPDVKNYNHTFSYLKAAVAEGTEIWGYFTNYSQTTMTNVWVTSKDDIKLNLGDVAPGETVMFAVKCTIETKNIYVWWDNRDCALDFAVYCYTNEVAV